jgi:peptidoglycan/LPS O-acetylase OafA/YrhL
MKNKILGLDGIRALAVITVVLTHLGIYNHFTSRGWVSPEYLIPFSGSVGVTVFFVLSGFLITTLLVKEYDANGRISIKDFYIRRTLRIFPLYFTVVGLTTLFSYLGYVNIKIESFYYAFTYTYNFVPREYYSPLLGHTWSLAVEEHFYLVWPIIFSLFFGRKTKFLVLLSIVCILLFSYFQDFLFSSHAKFFFIERWTITAGTAIFIGAIMALFLESGKYKATMRILMGHNITLLFGIFAYLHTIIFGVMSYNGLRMNIIAVGAVLIIAWISLNQKSLLAKALSFPPLRYIGVISYGVYMWQGFFLSTGPARSASALWPLPSTTGLILLILVAPLSYHCIEKPILRFKKNFEPKRR